MIRQIKLTHYYNLSGLAWQSASLHARLTRDPPEGQVRIVNFRAAAPLLFAPARAVILNVRVRRWFATGAGAKALNSFRMDESQRQFARLITRHERLVYGYILSLVPHLADADEILQETNVKLWEEFDKFVLGTNFAAWSIRVAHFQVLTWRKQSSRRRMVFDQRVIDSIAEEPSWTDQQFEARQQALGKCLGELPDHSRELLRQCYARGSKIKDVAARFERTSGSVYKALERIREVLFVCIEQRLAAEEAN